MFETGKVFQVARERQAYNLDILGLAETRWNQTEKERLSTGEQLILYSGHPDENARHEEGVALMLSKKAERKSPSGLVFCRARSPKSGRGTSALCSKQVRFFRWQGKGRPTT